MPVFLLLLLLAAARERRRERRTARLRSGCSSDASALASLPAGAPVTIRYSISGESQPCYKVSVEVDGKTLEGYLPASAIGGLEDFDQARRQAVWLDTATVVESDPLHRSPAVSAWRNAARRGSRWRRQAVRPDRCQPSAKSLGTSGTPTEDPSRSYAAGHWPASPRGVPTTRTRPWSTGAHRSISRPSPKWRSSIARWSAKPKATRVTIVCTECACCCVTKARPFPPIPRAR